jgi:hypothetical protein
MDGASDAEASFARAVRAAAEAPDQGQATAVGRTTESIARAGAKLLVLEGPDTDGTAVAVTVTPAVIGRGRAADIPLSDPAVSLRHAELRLAAALPAPVFVLLDLGSTSGTLVNGIAVTGEVELRHGDVIAVGRTELRFLRHDEAPAQKAVAPSPPTFADQTEALTLRQETAVPKAEESAAPPDLRQRVRRTATVVIAGSVLLLVLLLAGRALYMRFFSDASPGQVRAQIAQLLPQGKKRLLELDVDGARATVETILALDPGNADAESLGRLVRTEADARDALTLALRLGDEDRDVEARQVLKRIPDASAFAPSRDRLEQALVDRALMRARREIEALLDAGRIPEALALAERTAAEHPRDPAMQTLLARVREAEARRPKHPLLAQARAMFAAGDVQGARVTAQDGGYRAYVRDLDDFEAALEKGKAALRRFDEKAAVPHLDEAWRLLAPLGGSAETPIVAETRRPYAKALVLAGSAKLDKGDGCGAARDLFRAARVAPQDVAVEQKLRRLEQKAEAGLVRARAARLQDPERAAAIARESLCYARSDTREADELRSLARFSP